jgi:hypothetical protein
VTTAEEITVTVNDVVIATPQLTYTTGAQTTTMGISSELITVQRTNSLGVPQTSGALVLNLTDNSATGNFRNATDGMWITTVTIPNGSSTASFRFRDTAVGNPTITVGAAGYTSASQVEAVVLPALVFTTAPQTTVAGVTSGTITVARRNSDGSARTSGSMTVNLTDNSATGAFRNTADSSTITSVTIANGASTASFRYRDTAAGTPTMTVASSGYSSATQQVTITAQPQLVFTTAPQSTQVNVSTGTITIQRQTSAGVPVTSGSLTVNLSDNSSTGGFRSATDGMNITSVTIANGSSTASFRFRDSASGTKTMTVAATGYASASQTVTITGLPKFVFTTSPQVTTPNVSTGVITVQRQSFGGTPLTTGSLVVNLAHSGTGSFRSATDGMNITSVTIANGSSTASFRFRASSAGNRTLTVSASGMTSASQTVTVNTPPTISGLNSSYTTPRNTARTISFTVGDAESGASAVTLSATLSNTNTIFNSGVTFPDNSGSSRSIRLEPRAGRSGTTTITVTASDGTSTTTRTFTFTVL